ncbi:MAG: GNAT family N-acetyltransferase [Rhodanobacter sp.]
MIASELDNPFWSSLRSRHRALAQCIGDAARYPAPYAPFLGVANAQADVAGAMIGERLGMDACREISAVCTHPDFLGRGYARRLVAQLSNDNRARGRLPFLHVSPQNRRAKRLYEQLGYRLRRDIGFWSLGRAPAWLASGATEP